MADPPMAGWYTDPAGSGQLRWWDGQRWTDATRNTAVDEGAAGGRRRGVVAGVVTAAVLLVGGGAGVGVWLAAPFEQTSGPAAGDTPEDASEDAPEDASEEAAARSEDGDALGSDSPTTAIHEFGTTALPELTLDLPQEAWQEPLDATPLDVGALDATAYVTTGTFDTDDPQGLQLTAFDLASGEQQWRHDLSGDGAAVVVAAGNESLLLRADDGGYHEAGDETRVTVLDRDGEELWTEAFFDWPPHTRLLPGPQLLLQTNADGVPRTRIVELASGDPVLEFEGRLLARHGPWSLLHEENDRIVVLDREGDERWSRRSTNSAAAALGDGLVYLVEDDRILALDAGSGEQRWTVELRQERAFEALRVPDVGVVVHGPGGIEAFGLEGERLWEHASGGGLTLLERGSQHVLLRIQDSIHSVDEPSEIEVLNAGTGHRLEHRVLAEQAWVYNQEARTPGQPVTADAVLVRDRGALSAIAYDGLEERWRLSTPDRRISAAVAIPGGVLALRWDDDRGHLVTYR